jgi:hypothetical protein
MSDRAPATPFFGGQRSADKDDGGEGRHCTAVCLQAGIDTGVPLRSDRVAASGYQSLSSLDPAAGAVFLDDFVFFISETGSAFSAGFGAAEVFPAVLS